MPGSFRSNAIWGVPNVPTTMPVVIRLNENTAIFEERNYTITGVTKDSTGVALAGCSVYLFNWTVGTLPVFSQLTTSDASGNYSFVVDKTQAWLVAAFNASGPVAGISRNDLTAS